jgi:Flp pilus assembly pilin Flp
MRDPLQRRTNEAGIRQRAQGMVEYGLILVLVSIAAIAGLLILGPKLSSAFSNIASSV